MQDGNLPFSFLENLVSEEDRLKFDGQVDDLVKHAVTALKADLCFIFLTEPSQADHVYVNQGFHALTEELQEYFSEVALKAIAEGTAITSFTKKQSNLPQNPDLSHGGEWSFLAGLLFDRHYNAVGVILTAKQKLDSWTEYDRNGLAFLSDSASVFLQLRETIFQLRAAEAARRTTEDSLSESEEKFSALAKNVPGAIFRYIRNRDGQDEVEFMSPGCVDIWGYTAEELEADPTLLWAAIVPEDSEALQASLQQSLNNLSQWQHRWRIKTKDGFLKWLQSYGTPYRMADGEVAWNTLILDVTVEQEAQIALAENARNLHEAQKLDIIGRVAGGVAHDFNNLLSVIVGNAEAINAANLRPDDSEAVNEIIEAAQRGALLVKHLLSFARKSDLRTTITDINTVLSGVDRILRRVLPANISIEISQRAGLWPVQIDQNMFESALLNIVLNGRDALPRGGAITIETSNVRVDDDYLDLRDEDAPPGRYVMVAITDTGTGIEDTVLPYVFEPFFTTKGPNDGTGLGLAMVQGFVKQSGGIVRIYSEPGHGTSIKMYFPATDGIADAAGVPRQALPVAERRPGTVLLVEDQEPVRAAIERTLTSAGYRVISASSGDEAITIYREVHQNIDIMVTDVVMPGQLQGPQLVHRAREINHRLPVLYMSGYPHEANVHGNGVRSNDISLMKPVRRNDLLTALIKLRRQS